MHSNFSTKYMREVGGKDYFEALMKQFETNIDDHIAVYGPDNHMRLTGKHETAPWNKFSYGVADRGASIRVPHSFVNNGYKGYLEDRRPNSMGDPYQIASQILKTISEVPTGRQSQRGRLSHPATIAPKRSSSGAPQGAPFFLRRASKPQRDRSGDGLGAGAQPACAAAAARRPPAVRGAGTSGAAHMRLRPPCLAS